MIQSSFEEGEKEDDNKEVALVVNPRKKVWVSTMPTQTKALREECVTQQTVNHNGSLTYCYGSQWKTDNSKPEQKVDSLPLLGLLPATLSTLLHHSRRLIQVPPYKITVHNSSL
jgi:hypothetical protein